MEENPGQQKHPMGQDLMRRLAAHASGGFLRLSWPKNAISLLAAEVLELRERLDRLEAQNEKPER